MQKPFDAIIIGAGHNGLVSAGYLARSGMSVLVLEARNIVGGACVTEELFPGAHYSTCAFVQGKFRQEIISDLDLLSNGLEMEAPDVQGFALFPDGSHVFLWKDPDRTIRALETISKDDAKGYLEFGTKLKRFGELMRPLHFDENVPTRSEVMKVFENAGETQLLNEFMFGSTRSLLQKYFTSEHVRGFLAFYGLVSIEAGPDTPETAYLYGYHATGEFEDITGRWAFVKGGMGGITQALRKSAEAMGAVVFTGTPVDRILVKEKKAVGVRTMGGEEFHAPIVISNAHPKFTFLKLLGEGDIDKKFRSAVERIDVKGALGRVHLLVDELPHYVGFDSAEVGPQHSGHCLLGCSLEVFQKAYEAQLKGTWPEEMSVELIIQSVKEPELAPPGMHTITLGVQHTPYDLAEGTWDERREEWADTVMENVFKYAPNLRDHIVDRKIITPHDLEQEWNLIGGNIFHVAMTLEHSFDSRPTPLSGGYRGPLSGLYLCGAGTHPGGAVTGLPGRNAALTVIKDQFRDAPRSTEGRIGRLTSSKLLASMTESELGLKIAYEVARNPIFRPLVHAVGKNR